MVTTTHMPRPNAPSNSILTQSHTSSFKHALLGQKGDSSDLNNHISVQRFPSVWEKDEVKRIVKSKFIFEALNMSHMLISI
jgi:hypothetical protein